MLRNLTPYLAALAALLATGCLNEPVNNDVFLNKDGPRSLSKGLFRNTALGYSLVYPKGWTGGIIQSADAVGYWSAVGGTAYLMVYECPGDSLSLCEIFRDADREHGVPGAQMRQGVEVIASVTTDTTETRIGMLQRLHFQRGNTLVMLWLRGAPEDFGSGTNLKRVDSSLTFF